MRRTRCPRPDTITRFGLRSARSFWEMTASGRCGSRLFVFIEVGQRWEVGRRCSSLTGSAAPAVHWQTPQEERIFLSLVFNLNASAEENVSWQRGAEKQKWPEQEKNKQPRGNQCYAPSIRHGWIFTSPRVILFQEIMHYIHRCLFRSVGLEQKYFRHPKCPVFFKYISLTPPFEESQESCARCSKLCQTLLFAVNYLCWPELSLLGEFE